jgi:hypothetical protein
MYHIFVAKILILNINFTTENNTANIQIIIIKITVLYQSNKTVLYLFFMINKYYQDLIKCKVYQPIDIRYHRR